MQSNQTVQVPERVAFVNLNNGSVFFDCHPSEARTAMQAVKDMREKGSPEKRQREREVKIFKETVDTVLTMGLKPINMELVGEEGELTLGFLAKRFDDIERCNAEVTLLVINSQEYVYFRTLGRTIFDEPTKMEIEEMGCFGHIWTANIAVREQCKPGEMFFAGRDKEGTLVATRIVASFKPVTVDIQDILTRLSTVSAEVCEIETKVRKTLEPKDREVITRQSIVANQLPACPFCGAIPKQISPKKWQIEHFEECYLGDEDHEYYIESDEDYLCEIETWCKRIPSVL